MKQLRRGLLSLFALLILISSASALETKATVQQAINLNTATVEQLTTLPSVGPKRAEEIVQRRQQKPFKSVDELLEVKGIGEKTMEKLRPLVTVAP